MIQLQLQNDLLKLFIKYKDDGKITHYLNDSKTWYVTPSQAKAYLDSHDDPKYASKMLGPEYALLQNNVDLIVEGLPEEFVYVDLGPGLAKKSRLILEHAIATGRKPVYSAVDISPIMLETAEHTLSDLNLESKTFLGDFSKKDNLYLVNKQLPNKPKFVYLGATISNYNTAYILDVLSSCFSSDDLVYLSMQEKPENIDFVIKQYETQAYTQGLAEGVRQLGFDSTKMKVRFNEETHDVENYLEVEEVPFLLENMNVKAGDEVVFFTSKKSTRNYFQQHVDQFFEGNYIFEQGFMGFVGNSKR